MARKKAEPGTGEKAPPAKDETARDDATGWGAETPPEAVDAASPIPAPEPPTEDLPEGTERPLSDLPLTPAPTESGVAETVVPSEVVPSDSEAPREPVAPEADAGIAANGEASTGEASTGEVSGDSLAASDTREPALESPPEFLPEPPPDLAEEPTAAPADEAVAEPRPWGHPAMAQDAGAPPDAARIEPVEPADPWIRAEGHPGETAPPAPPAEEEMVEEAHGWSFAAKTLAVLALLIVGAVAGLWAAPRVAPHLPAGMAPVAAWLTPGAAETEARLAALDDRLQGEVAALQAQVQGLPSADSLRGEAQGLVDQASAGLSGDISALRDRLDKAGDPADRFGRIETTLAGLTAQLDTLKGQIGTEAGAAGAAGLDAYRAELDGLRAEVGRLSGEVSSQGDRLARAQQDLATRASAAEASAEQARTEAATSVDLAATRADLAQIRAALVSGAPFQAELDRLGGEAGVAIPAGLSGAAATGVATTAALEAEFPEAAHAAIRSSIVAASAGEGFWDRSRAFLTAQVASRSLTAQPGSSPDAVLSRVEAALKGGDLKTAVAEAETLPSEAKAAMADWIAKAQQRLDAEAGLAELSAAPNMN